MVGIELARSANLINQGKPLFQSLAERNRHSMIQRNNGRGLDDSQLAIERRNLLPVSFLRCGRLGMECSNGRLQLVWSDTMQSQCLLHQAQPFLNLFAVPQRPVLIFEQHQFAFRCDPGVAPRIVQQHQRQ